MTRVKRGLAKHKRHKRLLSKTKGYFLQRKNVFKRAKQTLLRAYAYAFKGRKLKKRDMRSLFITRIKAGAESCNSKYNLMIHGLEVAQVKLNRKMLSQLAVYDFPVFNHLVKMAQSTL